MEGSSSATRPARWVPFQFAFAAALALATACFAAAPALATACFAAAPALATAVLAPYHLGMLDGSRIAVVVPAYNEERLLKVTLATMPSFVDWVIVVDDASRDDTAVVARDFAGPRVLLECHAQNRGVGAAIVTGYRAAARLSADVVAVMAADAQMHPDDLAAVARPVARGDVDYVKGDRFSHPDVEHIMPRARHLVGRLLSWLTRRAAGLAQLSDSQCGYTAISARALAVLALDRLFPRYGYPNDLVGMLALAGFSIRDVPVRPVYRDEKSGIRAWHVLVIAGLIARIAARRLLQSRPEKLESRLQRARAMISSM